jgi:hypothetical protein
MPSPVSRTPVLSVSATFALVALAFSSGCELEDDSVELDDEDVGTSEMAISATFDQNAAKSKCEQRHQVWKNNACLKTCQSNFVMENEICIHKKTVEYKTYCQSTLQGVWNGGVCQTLYPCPQGDPAKPAPSNTGGSGFGSSYKPPTFDLYAPVWQCKQIDEVDAKWFKNGSSDGAVEPLPCFGATCPGYDGDPKTPIPTDFNPDDKCVNPSFCFPT